MVWTEKESKKNPRHRELVYYRCGERGHMSRNCRSKATECKNCGRKGHRARLLGEEHEMLEMPKDGA